MRATKIGNILLRKAGSDVGLYQNSGSGILGHYKQRLKNILKPNTRNRQGK